MKKIAILGAMEIEIKPILAKLDSYETIEYANNIYYVAEYRDKMLIIAYSRIGKVFSAITATIMIEHFGAEFLLFTGVAGGLQDLEVGDIIAATGTVQHDLDITVFGYSYGKIPTSEINIETSKELLDKAELVAKELEFDLKTGIIATGDQFIHSTKKKKFIIKEFAAKAIDMESGSVNLVCNELGVSSLIVRSISDTANGDASKNFSEFAMIASQQSADFIMGMIKIM